MNDNQFEVRFKGFDKCRIKKNGSVSKQRTMSGVSGALVMVLPCMRLRVHSTSSAALTCAVLAPAGPNRLRVLVSLCRDERTIHLPIQA